jgi:hypothetical protein
MRNLFKDDLTSQSVKEGRRPLQQPRPSFGLLDGKSLDLTR